MKIRFAIDDTLNTHLPITPAPSTSSLTTATFQNFRESAPGVEERAVEFRERPLIIVSRCRVGIYIGASFWLETAPWGLQTQGAHEELEAGARINEFQYDLCSRTARATASRMCLDAARKASSSPLLPASR